MTEPSFCSNPYRQKLGPCRDPANYRQQYGEYARTVWHKPYYGTAVRYGRGLYQGFSGFGFGIETLGGGFRFRSKARFGPVSSVIHVDFFWNIWSKLPKFGRILL